MTKIPLTDLSLIIFSISQKFKFDYFLKNCHFYALYSRSMSAILIEDFHGYGLNTCLCLKFSLEKGKRYVPSKSSWALSFFSSALRTPALIASYI